MKHGFQRFFITFFALFMFAGAGAGITSAVKNEISHFPARTIRQRKIPKTLLYAEIQSYLLVENYLHFWLDRPLFHDSSMRGAGAYENSFLREIETLKSYNINGFCMLAVPSKLNEYSSHLQTLQKHPPSPAFLICRVPVICANRIRNGLTSIWKTTKKLSLPRTRRVLTAKFRSGVI